MAGEATIHGTIMVIALTHTDGILLGVMDLDMQDGMILGILHGVIVDGTHPSIIVAGAIHGITVVDMVVIMEATTEEVTVMDMDMVLVSVTDIIPALAEADRVELLLVIDLQAVAVQVLQARVVDQLHHHQEAV